MKRQFFFAGVIAVFLAEIAALIVFALQTPNFSQDAVEVNEVVQSVTQNFNDLDGYENSAALDYVVLDNVGNVLYKTKYGLSESINAAVTHRDTLLDITIGNEIVGKVIIYNDGAQTLQAQKQTAVVVLSIAVVVQCAICVGYAAYLHLTVVKPFHKLKGFAERVAEAQAQQSKKELVAKLSHDIKTPVASIKAVSEVGIALASGEKDKANYTQIMGKTDQINTLVSNLFTATLEELQQLTVTPANIESKQIKSMLKNADYLHKATIPDIPDCLVIADGLRLQQVFDNIFANSYKYADTEMKVTVQKTDGRIDVVIEDFGGGVKSCELPTLKEKYKRGSNSANIEGAGLGLYISDYFVKEMGGELNVENGERGLKVTVSLALSGKPRTEPF